MQADWIAAQTGCLADPARRAVVDGIVTEFAGLKHVLAALPQQAIHNDANDYNVLVDGCLTRAPRISGLIDLGDMCVAPRICDLAIAAAYVVLDHPKQCAALPALVAGYHAVNPLTAQEVDLLWPLLRMRLAVSVVNSTLMATDNPDDPYVTISQGPAWRFLETHGLDASLVTARLRAAYAMPVVNGADRVTAWLDSARSSFAPLLGKDLADAPVGSLSVENSTCPQDPFAMPAEEAARVGEEFEDGGRI